MRAYVLIDASLNTSRKIVSELRKKSEIILADVVNGPHSIIACIEAKDPASIAQTILFDIRKIEGVNDLTVYLSAEEQKNTSVQANMPDELPLNPPQAVVGGQQLKAPASGVRNAEVVDKKNTRTGNSSDRE